MLTALVGVASVAVVLVIACPMAGASSSPVEEQAAHTFCGQVNAERAARHLTPLRCTYDGTAQAAVATHEDHTAVWVPLVPNPATAVISFMQSSDHRWWLMDPTATVMDIGVSCATYRTVDGWTRHGMYVGADLPDAHGPDGAPAPGHVTAPDSSTPCGDPQPPPTPSSGSPAPPAAPPTRRPDPPATHAPAPPAAPSSPPAATGPAPSSQSHGPASPPPTTTRPAHTRTSPASSGTGPASHPKRHAHARRESSEPHRAGTRAPAIRRTGGVRHAGTESPSALWVGLLSSAALLGVTTVVLIRRHGKTL